MLFWQSTMNGEGRILVRIEEMELFLEQQGIGAEFGAG